MTFLSPQEEHRRFIRSFTKVNRSMNELGWMRFSQTDGVNIAAGKYGMGSPGTCS